MRKYKVKKNRKIPYVLLIIFVVLFSLISFIDSQARPVFKSATENSCRSTANKIISSSVNDVMNSRLIEYSNFVSLLKNTEGYVTAVETNVSEINNFKVSVASEISKNLVTLEGMTFKIAIGSMSNIFILFGRGAKFEFRIDSIGAVNTNLISSFSSAGVNQTLHQIILEVDVEIVAIIPGGSTSVVTKSNFILAETVIVGKIPDSYTYITGDNRDIISKGNDYIN